MTRRSRDPLTLDQINQRMTGRALSHRFTITQLDPNGDAFTVKDEDDSASGNAYRVEKTWNGSFYCPCKSFAYRGNCKHLKALQLMFVKLGRTTVVIPAQFGMDDIDHSQEVEITDAPNQARD